MFYMSSIKKFRLNLASCIAPILKESEYKYNIEYKHRNHNQRALTSTQNVTITSSYFNFPGLIHCPIGVLATLECDGKCHLSPGKAHRPTNFFSHAFLHFMSEKCRHFWTAQYGHHRHYFLDMMNLMNPIKCYLVPSGNKPQALSP